MTVHLTTLRERAGRSVLLALALLVGCCALPSARASAAATPAAQATQPSDEVEGVQALLDVLDSEYRTADRAHEALAAARAREMAAAIRERVGRWRADGAGTELDAATRTAEQLQRTLTPTTDRLQPWPLPMSIAALGARLRDQLDQAGLSARASAKPYGAIASLLDDAGAAARGEQRASARADAAAAYALFASGPAARLQGANASLAAAVSDAFWSEERHQPGLLTALRVSGATAVARARERAQNEIETAATVLGDRSIGKETVVADAAVIVFREGLEAVLILAAITASFAGARRSLRRPVLIGAMLGLAASAVTYVLAQVLVDALGDGGLRLQAITGLLAIAVLLVVTNWFFHRVYWSEWIGRFHRRRRSLERFERFGFFSGQLVGLVLLGLTSVYREGFETVLFLQNLQVSAGTNATLLGVAIGLAGTLAVGFVTFRMERKLPYRRMLIVTGILIGLVLAVMVGTTVHTLQGLGWVSSTPTGLNLRLWWGQWLGVYSTWEGIGAQLAALLVVYGSYALARHLQRRRYRRGPAEIVGVGHEGAVG